MPLNDRSYASVKHKKVKETKQWKTGVEILFYSSDKKDLHTVIKENLDVNKYDFH